MSQIFKDPKENDDDFDAGFKIPDTKSIMQRLLYSEHQEETEEDKKQGKKPKQKPKKSSICMCGSPACGIGPFVETQGE